MRNPYNPGAGTRPPALVGRESAIREMDVTLQRLLRGTNSQSQLLTGLRGVGKTVLLNEFEELADGRGYFHEYIEVSEDGNLAPAAFVAAGAALALSAAQRRLSTPARAIRRRSARVEGTITWADGTTAPIGPDLVLDPLEGALRAMSWGLILLAASLAIARLT